MGSLRDLLIQRDRPGRLSLCTIETLYKVFIYPLENKISKQSPKTFVFDISDIHDWDIAALLWLFIGLDYYKSTYPLHSFQLRLPEKGSRGSNFLLGWDLWGLLVDMYPYYSVVLVPDQRDYFEDLNPPKGQTSTQYSTKDNLLRDLLDVNLAQIKCLTRLPGGRRKKAVNSDLCSRLRVKFTDLGLEFGKRFHNRYNNIPLENAKILFTDIINEALLLLSQFSNATFALMSLSIQEPDVLVFSIADNGDSLLRKIFPAQKILYPILYPRTYYCQDISSQRKAMIFDEATEPNHNKNRYLSIINVGGKAKVDVALEISNQLRYIRRDTVGDTYRGQLTLVSDDIITWYQPEKKGYKELKFPWTGNLLKVSIPLSWRV
jgi:hypothetical protein